MGGWWCNKQPQSNSDSGLGLFGLRLDWTGLDWTGSVTLEFDLGLSISFLTFFISG